MVLFFTITKLKTNKTFCVPITMDSSLEELGTYPIFDLIRINPPSPPLAKEGRGVVL